MLFWTKTPGARKLVPPGLRLTLPGTIMLNPVGDVLMLKDATPELAPSSEVPTTPCIKQVR